MPGKIDSLWLVCSRFTLRLFWVTMALWFGLSLNGCDASNPMTSEDQVEPSRVRWSANSESDQFRVSVWPEDGEARLGAFQVWRVQVDSRTGAPLEISQLAFTGGMPQHRHGFQSTPQVIEVLGAGEVRVDGVRFHMSGAWTLRVDFIGPEGPDAAEFEVSIDP